MVGLREIEFVSCLFELICGIDLLDEFFETALWAAHIPEIIEHAL